jgi:uncharacterized protein
MIDMKPHPKVMEKLRSMLIRQGAKKIGIFGSYARGEIRKGSDIDIMVEFSEGKSLLDLVRIERELSEVAGRKVDLLTEKSVSPYLIDRIKKEMRMVYE